VSFWTWICNPLLFVLLPFALGFRGRSPLIACEAESTQAAESDTDVSFHAETLEGLFNHDFTSDQTTAAILLDFLSKNADHSGRLSKKYYVGKFSTWLNGIIAEQWDIINVRHPIIAGVYSATYKTKKWLVLGVKPTMSKMPVVSITAVEIT